MGFTKDHQTKSGLANYEVSIHLPPLRAMLRSLVPAVSRKLPRQVRSLSGFSFTGAKNLSEIMDVAKASTLTSTEIASLWTEYHADKKGSVGWVCSNANTNNVIKKAADSKCPFFLAPVFNSSETPASAGYYNMIVQYFEPSHFILTDMGAYQSDPSNAPAMISFSVFDDFYDSHSITLVRGDIIAPSLTTPDSLKIINSVITNYSLHDEVGRVGYSSVDWVKVFNHEPDQFRFDIFVEFQRAAWFTDDHTEEHPVERTEEQESDTESKDEKI
jgi:hypothetical protein